MTIEKVLREVRASCAALAALNDAARQAVLMDLADRIDSAVPALLAANTIDLEQMDPSDPRYDRLLLTKARLFAIAHEMRAVAKSPDPLGAVLQESQLANGLLLQKISVPLGVVGVVYEARPNVTFDVFALCFRSGNAAVLKGGADAAATNQAAGELIASVLDEHGLPAACCYLLPPTREAVRALLQAQGLVDVVIPRGSNALIQAVREQACIPVIETGAGVVHTYLDATLDLAEAQRIVLNAKTRRVSVCNALDMLLVHRDQLPHLPTLLGPLAKARVVLEADTEVRAVLQSTYPPALLAEATDATNGTEFLSLRMAVRVVPDIETALAHIARHGSGHSEAIVSNDAHHIERFLNTVDAAVVYANASTAFTDGAQFGLGAEIGISTQKLHARGPMGLAALTSYKWIVRGQGQVRA
jgi:glutamate-5-semialdehyde dehydrogenase